jgi:glutamate synthase domain-containing protein 3
MTGVVPETLEEAKETAEVKALIEKHYNYTGSKRAKEILDNWQASAVKFVKVTTPAYKALLAKKEAV